MSTYYRTTKPSSNSKGLINPISFTQQNLRTNSSAASKAIRLSHVRPDLFQHGNSLDIINGNFPSSHTTGNDGRDAPSYSAKSLQHNSSTKRPATAPGYANHKRNETSRNAIHHKHERPTSAIGLGALLLSPTTGKVDLQTTNFASSILKDVRIVLPSTPSSKAAPQAQGSSNNNLYSPIYPPLITTGHERSPPAWVNSRKISNFYPNTSGYFDNGAKSQPTFSFERPQTAPETQTLRHQSSAPINISNSELDCSTISCLKRCDNSKSYRQNNVTFSPDTLNIERENKPKKLRLKNNRKPKFAHPCCGHFLPISHETIPFVGPDHLFSENLYTRYTSIWCGPMSRVSTDSVTKKSFRYQRFRNILADLSYAHDTFNQIQESHKAKLMIEQIIPRYISAMDIALMDCELEHVQRLLTTITSSLRILQINLHDVFFESNGRPKTMQQTPFDDDDLFTKLGPVIFALNRISGDQFNCGTDSPLPIEPQLVKLQLELLILTICPVDCVIFRSQLSVIPATAEKARALLQELKERRSYYCIKWVNDSVMHRDYMGLMKFFGFCDEIGAKNPVPLPQHQSHEKEQPQRSRSQPKQVHFCRDFVGARSDHHRRTDTSDGVSVSSRKTVNHFNSDHDLTEFM